MGLSSGAFSEGAVRPCSHHRFWAAGCGPVPDHWLAIAEAGVSPESPLSDRLAQPTPRAIDRGVPKPQITSREIFVGKQSPQRTRGLP
jgi:hypothetical protein